MSVGRALWWLSGLAVVALVVRALRQQQMSAPLPRLTVAAPAKVAKERLFRRLWRWLRSLPRGVWRWLRRNAEPVVMLAISIAIAGVGWWWYPPYDRDPPLPHVLGVKLPGYVNDGEGYWPFTDLTWSEIHAAAMQDKKALPPHTIRVSIMASYNKPMDYWHSVYSKDDPIEIDVDLPDHAEVINCHGATDQFGLTGDNPSRHTRCATKVRPHRYLSPLQTKRYLEVKGSVNGGMWQMSFYFDVKGVDGLSISTNRTRATVRIPRARPWSQSPAPVRYPLETFSESVIDYVPAVGKVTWSPRPSDEADDGVGWTQKSDNNAGNTPITGVKEDVLRGDHNREVQVGILFGLAVAALIGIVQSIFSARRERSRSA